MRGLDERMDSSASLPPQERAQLQRDVQDTSGRLRSLLYLAGGVINTLAVSTTEVCLLWCEGVVGVGCGSHSIMCNWLCAVLTLCVLGTCSLPDTRHLGLGM